MIWTNISGNVKLKNILKVMIYYYNALIYLFHRKVKKNTQQDFRNRVLSAGEDAPKGKRKRKNELPEISLYVFRIIRK